ncbi:MAG: hypothetical protein ABUK13_07885 [Gammaproteobacteria bacterium]
MQDISSSIADNLDVLIPILLVFIVLLVVYLTLMVRAIIEMLRYDETLILSRRKLFVVFGI